MRLIDADKLIEDIEKLNQELLKDLEYTDAEVLKVTNKAQLYIICESVIPKIKEQPTAFDIDNVVEHIKKGNRMIEESLKVPVDEVQKFMYEIQLYTANNIIDVIKGGGIDEV